MKKDARNKKDSFFEKKEEIVEEVIVEETKVVKSKMKLLSQRKYQVGLLVLIIIVIGALVAGYGFLKPSNAGTDGGKLSSSQISALIAEVGDKMVIPKGETPTIATVTDITKLENQPFFRNAQNGDKVMIFGSTNMAILYRPSIHKIVMVAPINAQNNPIAADSTPATPAPSGATTTVTPTPSAAPVPIRIAILNGTKEAGLAKKAEALIASDSVTVVSLGNTTGDYTTSSISNVSKTVKYSEVELQKVVSSLSKVKAKVITLPTGETAPDGVDIVVILGKDFADAQ